MSTDTEEDPILDLLERMDRFACVSCEQEIESGDRPPLSPITCPKCHHEQAVPGMLENFRIWKRLGHGAMGAVYQAHDETLLRQVAIKVLLKRTEADEHMAKRFLQEARAIALLNHPNVVQVYSFGEVNNKPYIAMELIEGDTLERFLTTQEFISEKRLLAIAIEVAKGLQAGDKLGMVHGDMKPENILINKEGVAKVVDFGLARAMQEEISGAFYATPYYVSPERCQKVPEDARSDIFSFGATLYHVLCQKPPFDGASPMATVKARFESLPPPAYEVRNDVSLATSNILSRMMEVNPEKRHPSYKTLILDFVKANSALEENRVTQRMAAMPVKKKTPWMALAGILAAVGITVAGMMISQTNKPDPVPPSEPGPVVDPDPSPIEPPPEPPALPPRPPPTEPTVDPATVPTEKRYWLNLRSHSRHNETCEYFENTSRGRYCTKEEGKPCGGCGG